MVRQPPHPTVHGQCVSFEYSTHDCHKLCYDIRSNECYRVVYYPRSNRKEIREISWIYNENQLNRLRHNWQNMPNEELRRKSLAVQMAYTLDEYVSRLTPIPTALISSSC